MVNLDYENIKNIILGTFFHEEETIYHVENHLKHYNLQLERSKVKNYLSQFLNEGFIKMYDDPSYGKIEFENSSDDYIEDYWFALTEKGRKEIGKNKSNSRF